MGKELRTYLFGKDNNEPKMYGYKLNVFINNLTITNSDFSDENINIDISFDEWNEISEFVKNEIERQKY